MTISRDNSIIYIMTKQPTPEELKESIRCHVKQSAETVRRLPSWMRTILSKYDLKKANKNLPSGVCPVCGTENINISGNKNKWYKFWQRKVKSGHAVCLNPKCQAECKLSVQIDFIQWDDIGD